MKKGFTIVELLVAMGLLAAVIATAGMIFHYSIEAQRTASATAEIMRTLRAITDQIDADFTSICKDMPVGVEFYKVVKGSDEKRVDSIVFFATGAFQTTNQYPNQTVRGNVARIYYGQSSRPDVNSFDPADCRNKILARKQVILTSDSSLTKPPGEANEYEFTSPEEQLNEVIAAGGIPLDWYRRLDLNPNDENDIPSYFAKGVDNFTVQLENSFTTGGSIIWWPQNSEIGTPGGPINFNLVKFTFTLFDSKGIIKNGRRFEYIVYVGK